MRFISSSADFSATLSRLVQLHDNVSIAVAWASAGTRPYTDFLKHKSKIRGAVIGTHFYQTHPDVLDDFAGSTTVKFVLQPRGVFHPKLYLFWTDTRWDAVVGSANFTAGAMQDNTELSIHLTQNDGSHFRHLLSLVIEYLKQAKTVDADEVRRYRELWKSKQPDLRKLVDQFGSRQPPQPAVSTPLMSMSWTDFLGEVQAKDAHGFRERLELLGRVRDAFTRYGAFNSIPLDLRKGVAGLQSQQLKNWEWFGSMTPNGAFRKRMNAQDPHFSSALDLIPLTGTVTESQYNSFVEEFVRGFPEGRSGIGTATRLLSMKRPDQFLCISSLNRDELKKRIGYPLLQSQDYERYWHEVVELVMATPWWKSAPPPEGDERLAWQGRAAMLDAVFYIPRQAS